MHRSARAQSDGLEQTRSISVPAPGPLADTAGLLIPSWLSPASYAFSSLSSAASSSSSAISRLCSVVRFHGSHLSRSLGVCPPAKAQACRYAVNHFRRLIFHFLSVARILNIPVANFPAHSAPLP